MIVKDRHQWWPVRLKWKRHASTRFFDWHGWQTGIESTGNSDHSEACVPGYRRVFGQTFHIGALKVMLGANVEPASQVQPPPRVA